MDGGRALALEDIEYIVYVEKPGPVEIAVEKRSYDVAWFNPITGELIKQKKDFKGEKFLGEPPDRTHDWVLRLSREGKKESMLKSLSFRGPHRGLAGSRAELPEGSVRNGRARRRYAVRSRSPSLTPPS